MKLLCYLLALAHIQSDNPMKCAYSRVVDKVGAKICDSYVVTEKKRSTSECNLKLLE